MSSLSFIAAIGTALTPDEGIDVAGLEAHLNDQWTHGMTGVLIGGTMGAMQMLSESTYRELVRLGVQFGAGRGEILVGVGDCGFSRTSDRVRYLADYPAVDGVVVLSPYLFRFSKDELIDYFTALADMAPAPLYLYDLPGFTGVRYETETILKLARHRNIHGIKCSGDLAWTRKLMEAAPEGFRVIVAQAELIDLLLRDGVRHHLDGIFALAPQWVQQVRDAAQAGDWTTAATAQRGVSDLLVVLKKYGVFPTFSAILNARGIPGNYAPRPFRPLTTAQVDLVLGEPIVRELLGVAAVTERAIEERVSVSVRRDLTTPAPSQAPAAAAGGDGDGDGTTRVRSK